MEGVSVQQAFCDNLWVQEQPCGTISWREYPSSRLYVTIYRFRSNPAGRLVNWETSRKGVRSLEIYLKKLAGRIIERECRPAGFL